MQTAYPIWLFPIKQKPQLILPLTEKFFLKEIDGKRSGEIFHFVTKPLTTEEKLHAAQLVYDAREQVRDSIRGFAYIKDKMGTIFSGQPAPPIKHA
ncbi:hypothetical protein A3D77_05135 [Candidatus Gottesmanbacteria bacterium RIFCSPHIGHO2_02_FULL_39_11]|uniref:Uncharacterized protein n=1 Tax=Candidatus Gottesmanbacteria bacterium RIFCSPHIGHO2_02_FULL_39_11 TaxID=1798382 RepID=A0A1F5ZN82_9BACT|nr:MAG: hypothetical protein A3D77_05135 [Candidatus Gottesmanbacteria bacterium RIFCSPHIGHO2_02_FULL_39_11]